MIYAVSRRTSDCEKRYHSSKLEFLAIVWALDRLRQFLLSLRFTIYAHCQALVHVNTMKTSSSQMVRWFASLAEFDFDVCHRKRERMTHVDALSRLPVETASELSDAAMYSISVYEDEILLYQHNDENLVRKIKILEKNVNERNSREKGEIKDFVPKDGLLYKRDIERDRELYVIPAAMKKAMVIKYHNFGSHFGVDRTVSRLREYYYFPGMRRYVRKHINSCLECIFAKNKVVRQAGELHTISKGKRPWDFCHVDHLGPFVSSTRGNKYVLAVICNLTKFTLLYAVKNVKVLTTVKKLEDLNSAESKTTGKTPFEMMYDYVPRFEDGLARFLTVDAENYTPPTEVRELVSERTDRMNRKAKEIYDKSRFTNVKYCVGDIVYIKQAKIATGDSTKLQARFKGPLVVVEVLPSDTYRVQGLNTHNRALRINTTVHVSQMKIWKDDLSEESEEECLDESSEMM